MNRYLDIERFGEYLARYYGSESNRRARLVGAGMRHESWYFDIVRFFGPKAVDPSAVRIMYDTTPRQLPDELITQFNAKIASSLRSEGRLYDGPQVVQITGAEWSAAPRSVSIRGLDYADQVAGFAMDLPDEMFRSWGGTIREYLRAKYCSYSLTDSPFNSGIGVCGVVVVEENERTYLLSVRRAAKLASLENSMGPSVAGSVEFAEDFENLAELIERSMSREVEEELGLKREEFSVRPMAYAREMLRGDRPQLFTLMQTSLDCQQITERINALPPESLEFSGFRFIELVDGRLAESEIAALNFEAKMNYYLLEEWLAG